MKCHEVDYQIIGDDLQMVEVELDPGETVIAEAGSMNYMEEGINFEAKLGDGSNPQAGLIDKLLSVGKRVLTGESIFLTHFTNEGHGKRHVTFGAPYPGKIICLDMAELGGEILCQKTPFSQQLWGLKSVLLSPSVWARGFLGAKASSFKGSEATAWCSSMPVGRLWRRSYKVTSS